MRRLTDPAPFPIGDTVTVTVDRPLGSVHPNHPDLIYPVNYGYVDAVPAPDGEWQDAYVLGIDTPVETFTGKVVAVIRRRNDVEDKWIVTPADMTLTEEEIRRCTDFQERYFETEIVM